MTRGLERRMSSADRAKDIASRVLEDGYDPLLACRELTELRRQLSGVPEELMYIFEGIASEVDDLSIGDERAHWAVASLKVKDAEAADYRERVRVVVETSLRRLMLQLNGSE